MTLETRHVLDIADLDALTLTCPHCHTTVVWKLNATETLYENYPACHKGDGMFRHGSIARHAVETLVNAVREFRDKSTTVANIAQVKIALTAQSFDATPKA